MQENIIGVDIGKLHLVPYDPRWAEVYANDELQLRKVLGELGESIEYHHVGSTAIPTVRLSKPMIDMLLGVNDEKEIVQICEKLEADGFRKKGDACGTYHGEEIYIRGEKGHTNHLHVLRIGSPQYQDILLFKEYMLAHPQEAEKYTRLKEQLIQDEKTSIFFGYTDAKEDFVIATLQKAKRFHKEQNKGYAGIMI